jgi:hypothetical protein
MERFRWCRWDEVISSVEERSKGRVSWVMVVG